MGSWRPDFLVEDDGSGHENFRLTEINARFCFNGFMHASYGQSALDEMGMKKAGLVGAADSTEVFQIHAFNSQSLTKSQFFNGLLDLFDHKRPLHLLKGEEKGIDIGMFIHTVQKQLGFAPRLITPAQLRLYFDPKDPSKVKLGCLVEASEATGPIFTTADGEVVEAIHRVGLELHQRELSTLHPEIMKQVGLRCFNDMRTILLVHDKRMLGIIKQELGPLVSRKVLTQAQAAALHRGIADTCLAGSQELQELLKSSQMDASLKDSYLLKPVRGGKGAGIVFGDEITNKEWLGALEQLKSPRLVRGTTMIVQTRIQQHLYSVLLKKSSELQRYVIVGTYHAVHGRYLGIGVWRSSSERICAVSSGGTWFCSVMKSK